MLYSIPHLLRFRFLLLAFDFGGLCLPAEEPFGVKSNSWHIGGLRYANEVQPNPLSEEENGEDGEYWA